MPYEIIERTWWKENHKYPNGLEPSIGNAKHVCYTETEKEAQAICRAHNDQTHIKDKEKNRLSLKYEYGEA